MLTPRRTRNYRLVILRRVLATITLLVLAITTIFILSDVLWVIVQNNSILPNVNTSIINKPAIKVGLPVRLKMPTINVDAAINYVGLTPDGTMDVKKDDIYGVAWYQPGPRPGEAGSAVIAGHYGWSKDNEASVFNNLHALTKGDEVLVTDEKGVTTTFVVIESRKYDPNADATSVFKSYDGKVHLNIITCDGTWENAKKTYSDRLVIFTDKKL